jgi:hypothetical protein
MLRMLAVAPEDGWAFVEDVSADQRWLIRPPYTSRSRFAVDAAVVAKAVSDHGFRATDEEFASWRELIAFLEGRILSTVDPALSDSERLQRLLPHATPEVLRRYLDRIESELLPQRQWDVALRLLTELLRLSTLKGDPALLERAVALLGTCRDMQSQAKTGHCQLTQALAVDMVPLVEQRYGWAMVTDLARLVAQRRQLFRVGA